MLNFSLANNLLKFFLIQGKTIEHFSSHNLFNFFYCSFSCFLLLLILFTIDLLICLISIDAVVIASPTYTHEEYIIKALQAKKAVFCEKPIAEKRKDVMKCYKTAKDVGKPLFCAFNRRFDPAYGSARDQIREGKIGHVHMMKCTARDSPIPTVDYIKTSGGIYHDCIVHDVDLQIWVLGELPDKVKTFCL